MFQEKGWSVYLNTENYHLESPHSASSNLYVCQNFTDPFGQQLQSSAYFKVLQLCTHVESTSAFLEQSSLLLVVHSFAQATAKPQSIHISGCIDAGWHYVPLWVLNGLLLSSQSLNEKMRRQRFNSPYS